MDLADAIGELDRDEFYNKYNIAVPDLGGFKIERMWFESWAEDRIGVVLFDRAYKTYSFVVLKDSEQGFQIASQKQCLPDVETAIDEMLQAFKDVKDEVVDG